MSAIVEKIQTAGSTAHAKSMNIIDNQIPPQRRSEIIRDVRQWANDNPGLATFVALQASFTVPPLLVFLLFAVTVLAASLATCVGIAIFTSVVFTGFCVGGALLLLLPSLFIGTVVACTAWTWITVSLYLVKRFNGGEIPSKRQIQGNLDHYTGGKVKLPNSSTERTGPRGIAGGGADPIGNVPIAVKTEEKYNGY